MINSLYIGDFDSEKYWRDDNITRLPFIKDNSNTAIILAMDELLFPFCNKNDVLITRFAFDKILKSYLSTIGFEFKSNKQNYHTEKDDINQSIFEIIYKDRKKFDDFLDNTDNCIRCSPYSVIPYADQLCKKAGFENSIASFETVKKVNSKIYSTMLNKIFGTGSHCDIVYSSSELLAKGTMLLEDGDFLIKDTFGVSGKGNILISSQYILERIVNYIKNYEKKGNICTFIIESFLDKELDFSCGLTIKENGKIEILGIQKMQNNNFAYGGSESADNEFIEFLINNNYFKAIENISTILYNEGYFGEVCVDSMLLKSGELVPIVEINARKSMGFINNKMDIHLSKFGLKGNLSNINIGITNQITFEDILTKLDDKNILFTKEKDFGIIPLSSNTIFANKILNEDNTGQKIYKGRFYYSVVSNDIFEKEKILFGLKSALDELCCKVYSNIIKERSYATQNRC